MAVDPTELSIQEIRRRFLQEGEAVSSHLMTRLRRDPRQGVRDLYRLLQRRQERDKEERRRLDALLNFERVLWKSGVRRIAGVDEAGVGPLAGPVVAAAVVFEPGTEIVGVDDSKRLAPERREELAAVIHRRASGVGVGVAEVEEIDLLNIHQASLLAMRRAVEALPEPPDHLLVDARQVPDLDIPQNPFQKGDGINFSIAAASIVAKTHRDRRMEELDLLYPDYGFARHKGYGTEEHQEAIRRHGPSPVHRRSFMVLRELCGEYSDLFYRLRGRLDGIGSPTELGAFEEALEGHRPALTDEEHRKLRLLVVRRWKTSK